MKLPFMVAFVCAPLMASIVDISSQQSVTLTPPQRLIITFRMVPNGDPINGTDAQFEVPGIDLDTSITRSTFECSFVTRSGRVFTPCGTTLVGEENGLPIAAILSGASSFPAVGADGAAQLEITATNNNHFLGAAFTISADPGETLGGPKSPITFFFGSRSGSVGYDIVRERVLLDNGAPDPAAVLVAPNQGPVGACRSLYQVNPAGKWVLASQVCDWIGAGKKALK
jgi:hypothetical protein